MSAASRYMCGLCILQWNLDCRTSCWYLVAEKYNNTKKKKEENQALWSHGVCSFFVVCFSMCKYFFLSWSFLSSVSASAASARVVGKLIGRRLFFLRFCILRRPIKRGGCVYGPVKKKLSLVWNESRGPACLWWCTQMVWRARVSTPFIVVSPDHRAHGEKPWPAERLHAQRPQPSSGELCYRCVWSFVHTP